MIINESLTAKDLAIMIGVGAILGAGVVTAILCTTKSGKSMIRKTKRQLFDTTDDIKDQVHLKAETAKSYAAHAEREGSSLIKDVQDKAKEINGDFKNGNKKITRDIRRTAEDISDSLQG